LIPYETFEKKGGPWKKKRGRNEAIKEEIAGRFFQKNYTNNFQVEGKINCYELTPLTTDFVNYEKGDLWFGSQSCPF
jgi:all-trans-retinol 13,14-reductase